MGLACRMECCPQSQLLLIMLETPTHPPLLCASSPPLPPTPHPSQPCLWPQLYRDHFLKALYALFPAGQEPQYILDAGLCLCVGVGG